jgi:hypothetical protein
MALTPFMEYRISFLWARREPFADQEMLYACWTVSYQGSCVVELMEWGVVRDNVSVYIEPYVPPVDDVRPVLRLLGDGVRLRTTAGTRIIVDTIPQVHPHLSTSDGCSENKLLRVSHRNGVTFFAGTLCFYSTLRILFAHLQPVRVLFFF